jgi:hypothetical protein
VGRRGRERKSRELAAPIQRPPGARIARVSVDDKTWEAFKALCGATPASIKLGELVQAEVRRSRSRDGDARAALNAARKRLDEVERLLP